MSGPAEAGLPIAFRVNGRAVTVATPPMRRLSEVLREDLSLTGTKVGCDAGDCGACTVQLDGQAVCACLVPIAQVADREVTTVEGLERDGRLDPLQSAFLAHGAVQCGACIPGMLMAAATIPAEKRDRSPPRSRMRSAASCVVAPAIGSIRDAVTASSGSPTPALAPARGQAVGARVTRLDGRAGSTAPSATRPTSRRLAR